jgi:type VII secretion-associated serine protease mycosin
MIQKLMIVLTLTLLAVSVRTVVSPNQFPSTVEGAAHSLAAKAAAPEAIDPAGQPQHPAQQAVKSIYLPLIAKNSCGAFPFNEFIPYNLSHINADTAWNCSLGAGVIVAVIDTGVDLDHPDLQPNLVTGKTFVSGTTSPNDDQGHGTHVAGIVAGVGNNGGIIGVAPEASIMPVKVLNSSGTGSIFDVADGISWAVDHGARVLNLSLGSSQNSSTLTSAVNYAYTKGAFIVAAAGNCGDSTYLLNGCTSQDQPQYPAALSNVMAVASVNAADSQSSFSNEGSYVEIAAPGSDIVSAYAGGGYESISGTSQATPHVAGLAAMIWSQLPALSNEQVRARIQATAQDLGTSGRDTKFGYGLIDVEAALRSSSATALAEIPGVSIPAAAGGAAAFVAGEVLVKMRSSNVSASSIIEKLDSAAGEIRVAAVLPELEVIKLAVPPGQEQQILADLRSVVEVEFAELNYLVTKQ